MIDLSKAPFPVKYRELWLPRAINGNATLPSSVQGGHGLTLTGARQGTTTDGVHFSGSATSYAQIVAEAGFNNQTKFVFFTRFKFDQTFQTGVATQWLYNKTLVNEWIKIYFDTADGKLTFSQGDGAGGELFTLKSATQTIWTAGTWYDICCTLTDAAGGAQKLEVSGIVMGNGVAAARNTPNGGDSYIGNQSAPGAAGFIGTISLVLADSVALTANQYNDLVKGVPYATPVYFFPMDLGRGVTLTNRGSGGNNGTLAAANTWTYGQVHQPVLSLDGINDYAITTANCDISGNITMAWAGKMKSTYNALSVDTRLFRIRADANNYMLLNYTISGLYWEGKGTGGGTIQVVTPTKPSIDDYAIHIGMASGSSVIAYLNGSLCGITTGLVARTVGGAQAVLGATQAPSLYDVSKPVFAAAIEGALTARQVLAYSRWLRDIFNLPINM